jgi:type I restriction enzyme M protein
MGGVKDAVLEIKDPNVLKEVVDEIDSIDFRRLGTDIKGDIFEYFLTHLGQSALNGQFRTPRQIRTMMVQMIDPDFNDTIYDPACGTAGFLIDSVEHILAKYSENPREVPIYGEEWLDDRGQDILAAKTAVPNLQTYRKGAGEKIPDWQTLEDSIYGIDVSRQLIRISMMNLVLHGIRNAHVKRANSLSELGGLTEDDLKRKYKVILSNPPFAGVLPKESIRTDLPTNSKKSELLFLGVIKGGMLTGVHQVDGTEQGRQAHIEHAAHAGLDQNVIPDGRYETGQRNADGIDIGKQARKREVALLVGERLLRNALLPVEQHHQGAHLRNIAARDRSDNGSR